MHACMHPCIHPSVRPSIRPSVHPSIHASIHTLQYNAIHHNTMQYNIIQYNKIQYKYNTIQCNFIPYNSIQYNPIQYNATQHNTIQDNTIQYNAYIHIYTYTFARIPSDFNFNICPIRSMCIKCFFFFSGAGTFESMQLSGTFSDAGPYRRPKHNAACRKGCSGLHWMTQQKPRSATTAEIQMNHQEHQEAVCMFNT